MTEAAGIMTHTMYRNRALPTGLGAAVAGLILLRRLVRFDFDTDASLV